MSSCPKRQPLARGDPQLPLHQVQAGDQLGDRVLDLEAGVHLHEVVRGRVGARDDELHRARAPVAAGAGRLHGGLAHRRPGRLVEQDGRAPPRSSSGGAAAASTRARRGAPRCRGRRPAPGSRCAGAGRSTAPPAGCRRRRSRGPRAGRRRSRRRAAPSSRTSRMPLPPPPADGFSSTGMPISRAASASCGVGQPAAAGAGHHRHPGRLHRLLGADLVAHQLDGRRRAAR